MPFAEQTETTTLRVQTARLVGRVRWAAATMGVVQAFLIADPTPVGGAAGILGGSAIMFAFNVAVTLIHRFPRRLRDAVIASAFGGDLAVVTTWALLTANDRWSTSYAAFGLVAIEAAALYRLRGTAVFLAAFAVAETATYALRLWAFDFPAQPGSVVYRVGLVVLSAIFIGAISEQSHKRRVRLLRAGARYRKLHAEVEQQASRLEESERRAQQVARSDPLTGVPNRRAWDEELARAMDAARASGEPLTVALLDLDGFKSFNDDWGHQHGDEHLRAFAARWRDALRSGDVLARLGGDEFAILLPGATAEEARAVIERLRMEMSNQVTFSVGIATWDRTEEAASLLSRADRALYESKPGSARRVVTVASHQALADWTMRLRDILARGDVRSAFQPIRRLGDRAIVAYEALARPTGFTSKDSVDELFAAAKRLGHTRDLDWLCRRAALSSSVIPSGTLIFVNVSVHALLDPLHDVDQMQLLMQWVGRNSRDVVLEISERDPVQDVGRLAEVLGAYRAEGFRFAVDDIGEGNSTLGVLATAVPEYVKVAGSLTAGALQPGPQAAVRALVEFCASSGTQLIAEGLESDLHVQLVLSLGVELGQGYALGAPQFRTGGFVPGLIEPVA